MTLRRNNHRYTKEDDAEIAALRKKGLTFREIAESMRKSTGVKLTENGVRHRAKHLRKTGVIPPNPPMAKKEGATPRPMFKAPTVAFERSTKVTPITSAWVLWSSAMGSVSRLSDTR